MTTEAEAPTVTRLLGEVISSEPAPGELRIFPYDLSFYLPGDAILQPGEDLQLRIAIPDHSLARRILKGRTKISERSNLAQSGLDERVDDTQPDKLSLIATLTNRGLHDLHIPGGETIPIGQLYAADLPLTGNSLLEAAQSIETERKCVLPIAGVPMFVVLPIVDSLVYVQPPPPLDLSRLPRGTQRKELHQMLGVERYSEVRKKHGRFIEPFVELVVTPHVTLKDNVALIVYGATDGAGGLYRNLDSVVIYHNNTNHEVIGEIRDHNTARPLKQLIFKVYRVQSQSLEQDC